MNVSVNTNTAISFKQYVTSSPKVWLGLVLWFLITAVIVFSLFYLTLAENKRVFVERASHAYNTVYEKISINETVLEGIAAMLRLSGDSPTVRQYTAEMRHAYPHIYSVGFQQYVPANRREKFEQQQRDKGYIDFRIKDFSYEGERVFHKIEPRASYYPTLFGESANPDAQQVLGLDMLAVPFLKGALLASIRSGKAVATRPFTLAEGGRGYVLFKSLETHPEFDPNKSTNIASTAVSILIKTDDLLRFASKAMPHANAKLRYQDAEEGEITEVISASEKTPYLVKVSTLEFQRQLDDFGQPFQLILQANNGLSSWYIGLGIALVFLSAFVSWFYFQNSYRRYLSNLGRDQALHDLAVEREGLEQQVVERTEALSQKTDEIRQLAGKLVNLQEDDYRHIARDLHDEFGQLITAICINTKLVSNRITDDPDATELSCETQLLVDQLHTSMHSLIGRLRPQALDTFGLSVSIEHCIELFKLSRSGIECQLALDPAIDQLPDNYAITIYRSVQELVNNAVKHGKSGVIVVNVRLVDSDVLINVDDDGCGMDVKNSPNGHGLSGLKERLLALNGVMEITSSPRGGCCIEIKMPLEIDYKEQVQS